MRLTVVIPTYNRCDMLGRALRAMLEQTLPADQYEIVVVDDGSTDSTAHVVATIGASAIGRLRYFRQENRGPATARNLGTREAKGNIVLFTGDDCIPDSRLLEEHLKAHDTQGDVGVLGHIAWHPDLDVTPFMAYLEEGVQFGFKYIKDPLDVPYWAFYTSNISLQKHWLEESGGFDEDFEYAAWEDIELGYRLHLRGLRVVYRPAAVTYHHHEATLERYLQRQRVAGRAAVLFWRKHPELTEDLGIAHATRIVAVHRFYEAALEYAHSVGIREALREDGKPEQDESAPLWRDAHLTDQGRAWIYEVCGGDDPVRKELVLRRRELRELRQEYGWVTSRRLYRASEALAKAAWSVLRMVRFRRKPSAAAGESKSAAVVADKEAEKKAAAEAEKD